MAVFSFITDYFTKEDSDYQDDYDGHYKYIKSKIVMPNFIRRIFGLPELKMDRRNRRFGRIRANLFYYITFPMLFVLSIVVYAAVAGFEVLVVYFNTNIYLNGLIISLMIFGILKTFHNSFLLYGTAMFTRKMEKVMYQDNITEDDIYMLRHSLEKQGELVNTLYMTQTIDNVEQFGHPNFNGMRSRLIKSKLGFRTKKNNSNVNFIAGILVMLGLLGTFLGLLATIDAVGEALNSMSNIGGDGGGEVGMEEMSGFIGSLAAPLQGMGLAFSSSLFGLSGSLLIGFFLHLSGTPQNEFIENLSRWIDDREIKFDPNVKKGSGAKVPPNDDDLKEWLSGFIHMSVRTNKHISTLSDNILTASNETNRAWSEIRGLSEAHKLLNSSTQVIAADIKAMREQGQVVAQSIPQIVNSVNSSQSTIVDKVETIRQDSTALAGHMSDSNKLMRHYLSFNKKEADENKPLIHEIKSLITQSNEMLNEVASSGRNQVDVQSFNQLKEALVNLDHKQTEVLNEIAALLNRLQEDPQMKQAQTLVEQLNDVLTDLNEKTKSFFRKNK